MIKNTQDSSKREEPYTLLRLDSKCNAQCLFCNVPPELYKLKKMSTSQARSEIDRLLSMDKELRLDITGGEPTLRRDLVELIKYASKKGIKTIQVQTNGILLADKEYVERLKGAGLNKAFVALHSSNPAIHDYLVGIKGAFRKCVAGIKNLLEFNIEVVLNPVVTTKSYRFLPHYIEFLHNHFPQIKLISLSVIQPRGRGWNNRYLVPRYKNMDLYIRNTLYLAKKCNLIVRNPYCGVPLCIGGWYQCLEYCSDYCINRSRLKFGFRSDQLSLGKIKGLHCSICDLNNFCNGTWKEYALIYPLSDLKPIKRQNGKFRLYSNNEKM